MNADKGRPEGAKRPGGEARSPRPAGAGGRRGAGRPGEGFEHRRAVPGQRGRAPQGKPAAPKGPGPRDVALNALRDVVHSDAYASQALDRQLTEARLRPDDRRLAASVFFTAVENRLYIDAMLGQLMATKPEPLIADILHIAAAQILFMDRVPDHAAVDEAVKQARAMKRDSLSGLVNGVLRSLIRARDAGELKLPNMEAEPEARLSVEYSLAPVIVERLVKAYGLEEAAGIARAMSHADHHSQTIRPNRAQIDGPAFEAWLNSQGMKWRRGLAEDAYMIEDAGNLAASEGYRTGLFSIQGESAMLAAQAVQAKPGMQILDACAAPGGKTCLMAEHMGGAGRVFAWDVHAHRVELIRAAAARLGLDNVRAIEHDARHPMESMRLAMDAVLVDAPCSGLGVIADKPDIKYRASAEVLDAMPPLQLGILESSAQSVRVGGLLVYATCTILPEENDGVVRKFLEKHPEFEPDAAANWLPEALRARLSDGMIQLLPNRDGLEGFFIARMRRKGVGRG